MSQKQLRALLVDDDSLTRLNLRFYLEKEGFVCEYAEDGREALWKMGTSCFDVVVTDLKMPNMNGHALAIELLIQSEPRPLICVLTAIHIPQLTRDLIIRGVDDVTLKTTNFTNYAAKIRAMVDARRQSKTQRKSAPQTTEKEETSQGDTSPSRRLPGRIKAGEELALVVQALPLSPRAAEVYQMAHKEEVECETIAACVSTDPSLTGEILRIGNSSVYNSSNESTSDMVELVKRVGRRRIGELALAASVSNVLKNLSSSIIDIDLARRRSMAARLTAEHLSSLQTTQVSPGVLVGAVMHCLGHVALSTAFPNEYETIQTVVAEGGATNIIEATRHVFGGSQSELMSRLLRYWKVPEQLTFPLSQIERPYADLIAHPEPHRTDIELLKISILSAWIACDKWENNDIVDPPSPMVLNRIRLGDICGLLENVRYELKQNNAPANNVAMCKGASPAYRCCVNGGFDFLAEILASFGVELSPWNGDSDTPLIINGLGAREPNLPFETTPAHTLIICEADKLPLWHPLGTPLALPTSYATLKTAINTLVSRVTPQPQGAR